MRRRGSGDALAWGLVAAAALAISSLRWRAADQFHALSVSSDVYALPPPEQTVVASLGYRSALADLIFANLLVSYGIHHHEKRPFDFVGDYLDTINALDPVFRDPYKFADTMLFFKAGLKAGETPRLEDYLKAREVLRRGLSSRPHDTELWLQAGQYLAYIAPPYLPSALGKEFKLEGAKTLSRACELASKNELVPFGCVTAATLFEKAGEREAAIESMKRLLAVTDNPEIERMALGYLKARMSEREQELQAHRKEAFRTVWKADLPFVTKDGMLVLGPRVDTSFCAGLAHAEEMRCAATWLDWARHADPDRSD